MKVIQRVKVYHNVLELWKQGRSNEFIAKEINVSLSTVDKIKRELKGQVGFEVSFNRHIKDRKGTGAKSKALTKVVYTDYIINQLKFERLTFIM